jgi:hypothetical protein
MFSMPPCSDSRFLCLTSCPTTFVDERKCGTIQKGLEKEEAPLFYGTATSTQGNQTSSEPTTMAMASLQVPSLPLLPARNGCASTRPRVAAFAFSCKYNQVFTASANWYRLESLTIISMRSYFIHSSE